METTKRIITVLILALFATNTAISTGAELSNTTNASCLLKITSNPAILPLEEDIVEYLLRSSGVAGKAAREVLDIEFDDELLDIEWLANEADVTLQNPYQEETQTSEYPGMLMREDMIYENQQSPPRISRRPRMTITPEPKNNIEYMILLRIAVDIEPVGIAAAQEYMNAIIKNLNVTLIGAFDVHKNRLTNQLQLADGETRRIEEELSKIQATVNNISGSHILNRNRILEKISDLRNEIQAIRMELASDDVIVESTTRQIMETKQKFFQQAEDDAIIKEMKRIVQLRLKEVEAEKKQVESGVKVRESYLAEAEEKLARLRIEMAHRQNELSKSSGGDLIESLNKQLAVRSIQTAQNQARFMSLEDQLAEAEALLDKADDYEMLTLKADIARQNLRESILWRNRMNRQIRMLQPPMVSVLGGN